MRAMAATGYGGPEVFAGIELPTPTPGPGEVLVRVRASSVNPADIGARSGMFGADPSALPAALGYDVAGEVAAVGPGVTRWAVGDAVFYPIPKGEAGRGGGYAEYHVAPETLPARMPKGLAWDAAGTAPVAGGTAWAALMSRAQVQPGESVLIHGGAGGVGHFAVQIARAVGAAGVFATCGAYDAAFVGSLGADRVIDYRSEDFGEIVMRETRGAGVDVCLTTVGGPTLARSIPILRTGGRAVTVTGPSPGLEEMAFPALMKNASVLFVNLTDPAPKLEALGELIDAGRVRPHLGATYPVTEVAEAHRMVEAGGANLRGKVAVTGFG